MQQHLDLIPRTVPGAIIYQRPTDGYISATAMCAKRRASSSNTTTKTKPRGTFWRNGDRGRNSDLDAGAVNQRRGHPFPRLLGPSPVAIHLGQWVSPKFAVQVSRWVFDWMSGKVAAPLAEMPYHLRRYVANQPNVPAGHFSILTEMTQLLIAPMEIMGYSLPEHRIQISRTARCSGSGYVMYRIDTNILPTYLHVFEDGRRVRPKAYPEQLLADFRRHFREEWLPHARLTPSARGTARRSPIFHGSSRTPRPRIN